MRSIRYVFWIIIYLTHISVLFIGSKGLLGREPKFVFKYYARKLGKNGSTKLIGLSVTISTIISLIYGSAGLYIIYQVIHFFIKVF